MADELRDAVRRGDLVRAQKLLEDPKTRRSINALDNGSSCLHLAIATKQMSMCLLLLSYGADVNQEDGCGYSPIHLAVLVAEQVVLSSLDRLSVSVVYILCIM
jgi:ankyrin repeat protein